MLSSLVWLSCSPRAFFSGLPTPLSVVSCFSLCYRPRVSLRVLPRVARLLAFPDASLPPALLLFPFFSFSILSFGLPSVSFRLLFVLLLFVRSSLFSFFYRLRFYFSCCLPFLSSFLKKTKKERKKHPEEGSVCLLPRSLLFLVLSFRLVSSSLFLCFCFYSPVASSCSVLCVALFASSHRLLSSSLL